MSAGDVVSAPPLGKRAGMIGRKVAEPVDGHTVGPREKASHYGAGNSLGAPGGMALQALSGVLVETGSLGGALLESVERSSKLWVGDNDFQHVPAWYPADISSFIEIECTWAGGCDPMQLHTCFGIDKCLSRCGNVQLFEK